MMQMYHGYGAGMTRHLAENYGHSEFHSGELRYDYPPLPPLPRAADLASLCSRLVDFGEGATGAGRKAQGG